MTFEIRRASNCVFGSDYEPPCEDAFEVNGVWYVKIYSFEELLILSEDLGEPLIVNYLNEEDHDNYIIMIYDDYLE